MCGEYVQRRRPTETVLYELVQGHLEVFFALAEDSAGARLPDYVERDSRKYLDSNDRYATSTCESRSVTNGPVMPGRHRLARHGQKTAFVNFETFPAM